jgi:hypothetical protein
MQSAAFNKNSDRADPDIAIDKKIAAGYGAERTSKWIGAYGTKPEVRGR